ncbi:MAG: hypothetical protein E7575_00065 [Ruminococcaceae bacterium]|nr:hypothetical protein [Oscillospiraceae bacterium]
MKKTLGAILGVFLALVTVFTSVPFTVSAADSVELIGEVQGSMPDIRISIDSGYSLDTIHKDKDEKIRTKVSVSGAWDSSFNFSSLGAELKTRGNSSWLMDKKPYQIKFDSKTDMFGMGKAKKWILLANYVDGSFVRNKIIFDLAENIGMPYTIKSVFVNLYINGDYKGVYQLCEKVEIGDNRVPLEDDFGVIAEMDAATRLEGEQFYFYSSVTGKPFVYKEYNTDFEDAPAEDVAAVRSFFENRINTLESELYNNGKNWELVESLIDIDSVIKFYFINELCMNADACFASTFFYIDGKDDILHMGPLWDYDRIFGYYDYVGGYVQGTEEDFLKNITDCTDKQRVEWYKMFFQYPEFVERVNELYSEVIKDEFDAERINATIDAYQKLLYNSLMRNYVDEGWALFHNNSEAEFFSNRTDATNYLNFTTNYLKNNIKDRIEYLNSAYGKYVPALFYQQNDGRVYSGGSMTDSANLSSLEMSLDSSIDGGISYIGSSPSGTIPAVADGERLSGVDISGLKISLTGNVKNYFSVQYRVCVNGNWSSWVSNGTLAGSRSGSPIKRIQVRLVEKQDVVLGTVSFDCAGVAQMDSVTDVVGDVVVLPEMSAEGYIFNGWYADPLYNEKIESITVSEGDTTVFASFTEERPVIVGDIDGDENHSSRDVNLLMKCVAGATVLTEKQMTAADMNGDGLVTATDVNMLIRKVAGIL